MQAAGAEKSDCLAVSVRSQTNPSFRFIALIDSELGRRIELVLMIRAVCAIQRSFGAHTTQKAWPSDTADQVNFVMILTKGDQILPGRIYQVDGIQ